MTPKTYYTVSRDALFKVRAICLSLADVPVLPSSFPFFLIFSFINNLI